MCASYGLDHGPRSATRDERAMDDLWDWELIRSWREFHDGLALITGARAKNLNLLVTDHDVLMGWWTLYPGGQKAPKGYDTFNAKSERLLASAWGSAVFAMPTDDPVTIAKAVGSVLAPKLEAGVRYVRAGVMLAEPSPAHTHSFLPTFQPDYDRRGVGQLLDRIHRHSGESSIGLGMAGFRLGSGFEMRREMLSRRATTHWNELAVVLAR